MICFNFQLWLWSLICWRLYPFHSLMFLINQVHKQDPVQPLNNIINIKWISPRIRIKYLLRSKQGCCKSQLWKSGMQVTIVPKYFRTIGSELRNNLLINCEAIDCEAVDCEAVDSLFNFQMWWWSLIGWKLFHFHSLLFLIYQVHK